MTRLSSASQTPLWEDQPPLLIDLAVTDLQAGGEVRPTLVAFHGDQPLFLATVRPFAKGHYHDPIIELGAVAHGFGANRLLLSLSGRAWSLHDPIAPVLDEGCDLRQRVIALNQVDASIQPVVVQTTIVPFEVDPDGEVTIGRTITVDDGQGWVHQALAAMASTAEVSDFDDSLARQVYRCEQLGHTIAWSRDLAAMIRQLDASDRP
ncbi:MAG: hypothetical protein ACR2HR_11435 [Euzebya sp.]